MDDGSYRFVGGEPLAMLRLSGDAFRGIPFGVSPLYVRPDVAEHLYRRGLAHPTPIAFNDPGALEPPAPIDALSVVIPVRDDPEGLAALLASLDPVTSRGARIVIVDDGSAVPVSAETLSAGGLGEQGESGNGGEVPGRGTPRVTVLRHDGSRGPAAARNAGIRAAEESGATEVLLLDADTSADGWDWLPLLRLHFERESVVAVAPRIVAADPGHLGIRGFETAGSALDMGDRPARVASRTSVPYVPSAALLLHLPRLRALLGDSVEFFAEDMNVAEDVDLCWRIVTAGGEIRYEPLSRVAHRHRLELLPMLRRRSFYGEGAARLAASHEDEIVPAIFSVSTLVAAAGLWWWRPWSVAGAAAATAWSVRTLRRSLGGDTALVARVAAKSLDGAFWQLASALLRPYAPATIAVIAAGLPTRTGRRAARILAVAGVAEGLRHWWRKRPTQRLPVDGPLGHIALHRADDLAYGIGVWKSALTARSPRALIPEIRR